MTENRSEALARLDVFAGEWVVEACFPSDQPVPPSDREAGSQARSRFDFTPLDFRQRYTGTFSEDGNTITGARERSLDGADWAHDFALTHRRAA